MACAQMKVLGDPCPQEQNPTKNRWNRGTILQGVLFAVSQGSPSCPSGNKLINACYLKAAFSPYLMSLFPYQELLPNNLLASQSFSQNLLLGKPSIRQKETSPL